MSTAIICLIPIAWTLAALWVGWYIGRHGSPVRWIGFRRGRAGGATRVAREYEP